jgi:hypothetical protein
VKRLTRRISPRELRWLRESKRQDRPYPDHGVLLVCGLRGRHGLDIYSGGKCLMIYKVYVAGIVSGVMLAYIVKSILDIFG